MDKILAPIKQRILQVIDFKRVERMKLFKKLEISSSNFRGKSLFSEVGGEVIVKILAEFTEVNVEWLLTGEGTMFKNQVLEKISDPASEKISLLEEKISLLEKNITALEAQIKDKQEKEVLYQEKIRFLEGCVNNPIYTNMSNIGVQKKL